MCREEFDSRCDESEHYSRRLCLRVKNIKKSENETSGVVLESIRKLFDKRNVVIPDACIDCAHCVSKTSDTVIVRFTTFKHRAMLYHNRKTLKGGAKVHLDLTKSRMDLLMKANKYVKDISNVDFAFSDINCRLKSNLISNIDCLER